MCQYHLSRFFKIEKTSMAIPDGIGQKYYRIVGKSLINQSAKGNDRILIPTYNNYQNVLRVDMLPPSERLVLHLIYNNTEAAAAICAQLQVQENFRSDVVESISQTASRIVHMTDPAAICSIVSRDLRSFTITANVAESSETNTAYNSFPPFIKHLVNVLVAPMTLTLGTSIFNLKNSATVTINNLGLTAVSLYNEVEPKYLYNRNDNILDIRTVIQFVGNSDVLNKKLARYECHPIIVQLFLGSQTINTREVAPAET